ncbi:hypothetical protein CBR_g30146 [Chara braunii]|uniref:Uncharacterized protein n=1 Tax=Chara braunii TaxID=69332 RepID=A0A388LC46_CHABU|nr:hypothetical protein CBR_g30146 [Chara braunii]|eukprot:GBG79880.1 hypothetical protein CBR_g30146 [Chara braunii]
MAIAAQQSSQASSLGTAGSTVAQTLSQSTGVMASQPIVLTSDEIAIHQAALQEAQLQKALGEIQAEKERTIRRRARMQRREADVAAFYNYCKQNPEEGMHLVYVSATGEPMKMSPEIEGVVAKYPDLFEEPTGIVEREVVHAIKIIPGSSIPKGRIYRMSPGELDELRRQLKELIEKGWIRPCLPLRITSFICAKEGGYAEDVH